MISIFRESRNTYGTRKIKRKLSEDGKRLSRRKIGRIMTKYGLVSKCILIDLYNREIIGYSAGKNKNAQLIYNAFLKCNYPISEINIFHTDRRSEFKNKIIDEVLKDFDIKRSLNKKGCPYDNAVAEATFKIFKTEFADITFSDFKELECRLFDYVNWYNHHRLHGALNYITPSNFKSSMTE